MFVKLNCLFFVAILFFSGCMKVSQLNPKIENNQLHVSIIHQQSPSADIAEEPRYEFIAATAPLFSDELTNSLRNFPYRLEATDSESKKKSDLENQIKTNQELLDDALELCNLSNLLWEKDNQKEAVSNLEQAISLIVQIDNGAPQTIMRQKEDIRYTIAKRLLEIHASRQEGIKGPHRSIPIDINQHVQSEIDLFTKGSERTFFKKALMRSGKYRSQIEKAFIKEGLPKELSWLPLIESGFKPKALSSARALGLWQFIPSTGYRYGLNRNYYIDERLDPEKSTRAAIKYLKDLHQIFGDWATVLAAYNCGEGRVLKLIRNKHIQYLDNFWDLYTQLPRETARYVPRFIATLHIVLNLKKYGLDTIKMEEPIAYKTVQMNQSVHFRDISAITGISLKVLKQLNPEIRLSHLPNKQYALKVPKKQSHILEAKKNKIPQSQIQIAQIIRHRVKSGETLSSIAELYHTSVTRIRRANNLKSSHFIVANKYIKVPLGRRTIGNGKNTGVNLVNKKGMIEHIVKSGESLWIIARKYQTTVLKLKRLNHLSSNRLQLRQTLYVPALNIEATSS